MIGQTFETSHAANPANPANVANRGTHASRNSHDSQHSQPLPLPAAVRHSHDSQHSHALGAFRVAWEPTPHADVVRPGGVCVACCAPWHVHSAWLRRACLTAGPTAQRAREAVLCCYGRTPRIPSSHTRDAGTGKQAGRSRALPGGYRHDRTPSHSERQPARTAGDQSANRLLPQPGRLSCDRKPAHALRPDQQQ